MSKTSFTNHNILTVYKFVSKISNIYNRLINIVLTNTIKHGKIHNLVNYKTKSKQNQVNQIQIYKTRNKMLKISGMTRV
jgi:hypothetical protein